MAPTGEPPAGEPRLAWVRNLALRHTAARERGRYRDLTRRLDLLERQLRSIYRSSRAGTIGASQPRIAEWLLDNEHLTSQALHQVRESLPRGFYHDLPKLRSGPARGRLRVDDLAGEIVSALESRISAERLTRIVDAYQEIRPLGTGELWALPAILQLVILESLTEAVEPLANELRGEAGRGESASRTEPLIAESIESLRFAAAYEWKRFFEAVSLVERALREDPTGTYDRMDFDTRDRYRKAVEETARGSALQEERIARAAVDLARGAGSDRQRERHVGFYLIDAGRKMLEREVACRPRLRVRRKRWILRHAQPLYFGGVGLLGLALLGVLLSHAVGAAPPWTWLLLVLLALAPTATVATSTINWIISHSIEPRMLPKLDFSLGLPESCRTAIAIPCLISDPREVRALMRHVEILCRGNSDSRLRVVLLTDFADAPEERMPGDDDLLRLTLQEVRELNRRRGGSGAPICLFHRERRWSPESACWMGWERKRGKLHEFNRYLLGEADGFSEREGDVEALVGTRFVITLDADTILPLAGAARLIGAMAHPLNRARFDETGRVLAGYTVLQPRVEVLPSVGEETLFARLGQSASGLDLYSHAVSDVYQDLFGEGIYAGKGIYDVGAFERSLRGRVPENAILSHDLFEGSHGRAGLVSDMALFEEFPTHVLAYLRRQNRWVRGDWQLLPWLFRRVPASSGGPIPTRFTGLDRWKILDNLRRSCVAPSLLLLLLTAWIASVGNPWFWTATAAVVIGFPAFLGAAASASRLAHEARRGVSGYAEGWRSTWLLARRSFAQDAMRWALALVLLPAEALVDMDAIGRTLLRLRTRRHLLEWTSAAHSTLDLREGGSLLVWRKLGTASAVGLGSFLLVAVRNPTAVAAVVPLTVLWTASPQIALLVSRPARAHATRLGASERLRLRRLAMRTWLFFERLVTPEDHWLPPDNYSEISEPRVAHRTSPTNIGMMLSATLAAYDLGFIGPLELEATTSNTLETLERLERHRGHFLNWYDTTDLRPLEPRYVSTVDSGNLAAALLTLSRGLQRLPEEDIVRAVLAEGLCDALAVLSELMLPLREGATASASSALASLLERIAAEVRRTEEDPPALAVQLRRIEETLLREADALTIELVEVGHPDPAKIDELRTWTGELHHRVFMLRRLLRTLTPWLELLDEAPPAPAHWAMDEELGQAWEDLISLLGQAPTIAGVADLTRRIGECLSRVEEGLGAAPDPPSEVRAWSARVAAALGKARVEASRLLANIEEIRVRCDGFVEQMDFRFLYDTRRSLFHIGYNVSSEALDLSYYDLLASEARLASFVAIAKGDVPVDHWLHLGRPFTRVGRGVALMSWSATMFEYLLPTQYMRTPPRTLLESSCRLAVRSQISFARRRAIPWGISEAAYSQLDAQSTYQYRAFGVPQLALGRDPGRRLVVAPYASLMGLEFAPVEVSRNLDRLEALNVIGALGPYESIDFGEADRSGPARPTIVRTHMAHHQGMILTAIDNFLNARIMVRRFHSDPRIAASEYLLQERVPWQVPARESLTHDDHAGRIETPIDVSPWRVPSDPSPPQAHLLSNGRYSVIVNGDGGGGSFWRGRALTRWSPDATVEESGTWVYALDLDSGGLWSAGYMPTRVEPETSEAYFAPHMAEFHRRDRGIALRMQVTIPPEDDLEIRRVQVTNTSERPRRVALVSYGEPVLTAREDDLRHPAYSKLFVEGSFEAEWNALLFRRRPRGESEAPAYLAHALVMERDRPGAVRWEMDRERFVGRGRTLRRPAGLGSGAADLPSTGDRTPDPAFSLAVELRLRPHESREVAFLTAAAASRHEVLRILDRYRALRECVLATDLARRGATRYLSEAGFSPGEAREAQTVLALLLYAQRAPAPDAAPFGRVQSSQPALWKFGISGDDPILLLVASSHHETNLAERLLRMHRLWRRGGIRVDLVLVGGESGGYAQPLRDRLFALIEETGSAEWFGRRGGVHLLPADQLDPEDLALLQASARVLLHADQGTLDRQLGWHGAAPMELPEFVPVATYPPPPESTPPLERRTDLHLDNGRGGFSPDGREYVIFLDPGDATPAPWTNVVANPDFGFLVTEAGGGCTWSGNSSENRLTPWRNDPVSDTPGEALYLRDEETGEIWTPTPAPAPAPAPYEVRHGAGYTVFLHDSHGLHHELRLFCPRDAPVKIVDLALTNLWDRPRRITVTSYAEWVLGTDRERTATHVATSYAGRAGALLAQNAFRAELGSRVAFLAANQAPHGFTTDRTEFLGRNGTYGAPAGLRRIGLSGTVGSGFDPCAAYQIHLDIAPGEACRCHFLLGEGRERDDALRLVERYRDPGAVDRAWTGVQRFWDGLLKRVHVKTPEPAMDLMLNRWLPYQALVSRLWGRTGLYQPSGAFGYRDQLQDVLCQFDLAPHLAREHLLRAAGRQFTEGDVLHWWQPESGAGVRTRCSDDMLWLAYVTAEYVRWTGDADVLLEEIPFLAGAELEAGEAESYALFVPASEAGTLYEHCLRAIDRGSTAGIHGLPLIGSGDWNDGLNRVGEGGRGESVWLGWFLYAVLESFAPLCELMDEPERAEALRQRAEALRRPLEEAGWDGEWYRRAYYDDGSPLGSALNREGRIDAISQAWAVLSGAAPPDRARLAMRSVTDLLVLENPGLVLLLAPPFDRVERDPGYIKGYPPGVRENGAQYCHAAVWVGWAFARLGDPDRALSVFRMVSPAHRAASQEAADLYRVEPYAVAGDIYSVPPNLGRGGWTWYTGAAAWLYRFGLQAILGLRREGERLFVEPCIPQEWEGFEATLPFGKSTYRIRVIRASPAEASREPIQLDGEPVPPGIPLSDDTGTHEIVVRLARAVHTITAR